MSPRFRRKGLTIFLVHLFVSSILVDVHLFRFPLDIEVV